MNKTKTIIKVCTGGRRKKIKEMKKILLLLLLVAAIAGCSTDSASNKTAKKTDLEEAGLKGKVKSVEQLEYLAVVVNEFGEIVNKGRFYNMTLIKYNEKGNKFEENIYNSGKQSVYKYDEKGNMIEENTYNADGSLSRNRTFKYDEKGNMIKENRNNYDTRLFESFIRKYDKKGNIIESNSCHYDGSLRDKAIYKYDEKGNKIEENIGYAKTEYTYDDNDNWTEITKYEGHDEVNIIERKIEYYEDKEQIINGK
jgi:hypothetical protein